MNTQLYQANAVPQRKIVHIDMDCFYAAVEVRDNPQLAGKPVAVGGHAEQRGVLCTCNYEARKFGLHSALPTSQALRLCPDLIVLPVEFTKYRQVSQAIHEIFKQYTDIIEPLSLDEAFLDVSEVKLFAGSATLIAQDIRAKIYSSQQLTASAGIAPNKMLAKIASDWNKPNGQFVIAPEMVAEFMLQLPIKKLFGVGKVTAEKMHNLNINTCSDLQKLSLAQLQQEFGKFGSQLYQMCRGIDERPVITERVRKSLSTEETFVQDYLPDTLPEEVFKQLYTELQSRLSKTKESKNNIKSVFVKIKFSDFTATTIQSIATNISLKQFVQLFKIRATQHNKPIRLIGFGVSFAENTIHNKEKQLEFQFSDN